MISRRILAAVALLCAAAIAPAHAQKTKAQINTEITSSFPNNAVGAITPLALRTVSSDIVNSIMPASPVVSGNLPCFDGTTGLLKDCGSSPSQWQLPSHAIAIGQGTGLGLGSIAPGPSGSLLQSQGLSSDPAYTTFPAAMLGLCGTEFSFPVYYSGAWKCSTAAAPLAAVLNGTLNINPLAGSNQPGLNITTSGPSSGFVTGALYTNLIQGSYNSIVRGNGAPGTPTGSNWALAQFSASVGAGFDTQDSLGNQVVGQAYGISAGTVTNAANNTQADLVGASFGYSNWFNLQYSRGYGITASATVAENPNLPGTYGTNPTLIGAEIASSIVSGGTVTDRLGVNILSYLTGTASRLNTAISIQRGNPGGEYSQVITLNPYADGATAPMVLKTTGDVIYVPTAQTFNSFINAPTAITGYVFNTLHSILTGSGVLTLGDTTVNGTMALKGPTGGNVNYATQLGAGIPQWTFGQDGANSDRFYIYNVGLALNALTINKTTNQASLAALTTAGLVTTTSAGALSSIATGTGVQTALGVNVGSAGAPVLFNGALGTPSSGVATNLTGTASGLTAGNVTTNANLTGPVTSVGNATSIGANQVTRAMEAQGVARSVVGVTGNATANLADIQGTTDQVLRVNGAGTALAFGAIDLSKAAAATGVLQAASFPALTGDVTTSSGSLATTLATAQPAVHTWALAQTFTVAPVFTDASGSRTALGLGTMATQAASAVAITGGTLGSAVTHNGATYPAIAQGDVLYGSAANTVSSLAKNTNATRYLSNTGASNIPAWAQIDLTNGVTGALPIANGGTNATTAQGAAANLKAPYVLGQSYVQVSHTGDLVESTLATITVPANAMGPNGCVRVTFYVSLTNSANTKTIRAYFNGTGGTSYINNGFTTVNSVRPQVQICNRNATNSQVGNNYQAQGGFGGVATSPVTSAVDTTAAVNVVITGQLANSGETISLEGYTAELLVP